MMRTIFTLALALAACWFRPLSLTAQTLVPAETHCLLVPLDPAARTARASRIVEAEVLDVVGFRGKNGRIFTRHQLRVFKQLKGPAQPTLTLITEGGTVGLERQQLTNTLSLVPGEQGVFYLEPAAFAGLAAGSEWQAYGSEQGFIRYDVRAGTAAEPFRRYSLTDATFYSAVAGDAPQLVQANPSLDAALQQLRQPAAAAKGAAPVITTLSPASLTAGTSAVLTISGSGFGGTRGTGSVEFRNADDGGATYTKVNDDDYLSWTDTRIQVRVPSLSAGRNPAGTGPVRVTTSGQLATVSLGSVTIVYAATNVLDTNTGQRAVPGHRNFDGAGGMTFRLDPDFASNTAAAASWQRALATWRCQTGVNWTLGTTRSKSGVADDGENSVGFDGGGQLPSGVLGRTTSYYRGCYRANGSVVFYVQEVDTQFDDAAAWQFGPANPSVTQLDFESVAVHELGHAQQLSHLILPTAVMHFAIARGQRSRTLAASSDIAGGRYILRTRSFQPDICGPSPMLPAPLTSQAAVLASGSGVTVQWTTREECYLSGFVVERASADTTAGWQAVATVAAGAGGGQYRFVDAQPRPGLSYYRLRVRRPDGSLDAALPMGVTDEAAAATSLLIYPNPVNGYGPINLQYVGGAAAGAVVVRFYDAVGRYLGGTRFEYLPGVNITTINSPPLRAGYYLIRWTDTNGRDGTTPFVVTE
ncbi:matrixin family metalloprotease [Hymenobacter endophyticus]|uniref:Matrixin family metalloprotease n=1 Tax=Hymenobacter endophyticus TaxID=3076335 RepID=A0ABU3THD7_9BACT|nr:matrixin family metalloprotease [Hymenobacter endophyticus]MDU0370774.1 matrixin family metalloprotease [Hymenobacter endophyticus]